MEPTQRRPGRPKGSKNKPKEDFPGKTRNLPEPDFPPPPPTAMPGPRKVYHPTPAEIDLTKPMGLDYMPGANDYYTGTLSSPIIAVHVSYKGSFGDKEWDEEIVWPTNWPLPRYGNNINLGPGKGGTVSNTTFDVANNLISIRLS